MKIVNFLFFWGLIALIINIFGAWSALLWVLCFFIVFFISKNKHNVQYSNVIIFSFLYLTLMGTLAMFSYKVFSNFTFSPYNDDSFYYLNIVNIIDGKIVSNATIYESFMAFIVYPLSLIKEIEHFDIVVFNWIIGALTIGESLKFANRVFPDNTKYNDMLGALLVLFNSNFIIGTVHLYRDVAMCYCFMLSINYAMTGKTYKSVIFAVLTGFVRGANGIFALLMIFVLRYVDVLRRFSKRILILTFTFSLIFIISLDSYIGYSSYFRSFNSTSDNQSLQDRIENRQEDFYERYEGAGGVLAIMKSDNVALKALVVPIYMFSPIKIGKFYVTENYSLENKPNKIITRFRIEWLWELISVIFTAMFAYFLFIGLYNMLKSKDNLHFLLAVIFLLMVTVVAFISMQHRHKIMFLLLFPMLYNSYKFNSRFRASKKVEYLFIVISLFIVIFYNLV